MDKFDVVVIGGGPAGLAAAISASKNGAATLLIEREARLGGILKQCIHDGFGLVRFKEKLSGPEYAEKFIEEFESMKIQSMTLTFVTKIERREKGFEIFFVNRDGAKTVFAKSIVLATGCRERTAKQVFIHGERPSGVFTAGTAQAFTNLYGQLPTKKCVILGSGDIGLIMARRLTLEGAEVVGVYEAKSTPSGLTRNIHQCLNDFEIPLHLSTTVTKVFGHDRLSAVEISKVDEKMRPIAGSEQIISCDALILSVGLIPENELAESIGVKLDKNAKGAACDGQFMTNVDGVFTCGNATHVNDLVDYVSESGELAGENAAKFAYAKRELIDVEVGDKILYLVPEKINLLADNSKTIVYFRSKLELDKCKICVIINGEKVFEKGYSSLRPPEMERFSFDFGKFNLNSQSKVKFEIISEGEQK